MRKFLKQLLDEIIKFFKNNIVKIFLFFILLIMILGYIYHYHVQSPTLEKIVKIQSQFSTDNYKIPFFVAKRYLIWFNMRSFYYALEYSLTLLGIVASLMTAFYATRTKKEEEENRNYIIFLSLLSICFTIANIFINTNSLANMAQHTWRELDISIMETLYSPDLSNDEKDRTLIDKVVELERYLETFEH